MSSGKAQIWNDGFKNRVRKKQLENLSAKLRVKLTVVQPCFLCS